MPFKLDTYLQRLGLSDVPSGIDGLHQLQFAQICALPFENVYPYLGRVPSLDEEDLWQKLVVDLCGGFCFELNVLLGLALEQLGYAGKPVLARVRMGAPEGGARTHLAHVVTHQGTEWLVDAGFGSQAPFHPVNISSGREQEIRGHLFRIRRDDIAGEQVLERKTETGWLPLFGFDRVAPRAIDLEASTFLAARWPREPFSSSIKAYRGTETGWISFQDGRARIVENGSKRSWELNSASELTDFLRLEMDLGYPAEDLAAVADRLLSTGPA